MANTLTAVSAIIKSKLAALTNGTDPIFASVLEESRGDKTNYPCAEILPTGGATTKRIDTGRNERTFIFKIMLYQEQSEQGKTSEGANDRLKSVVDIVQTAFDTDKDLSMEVENCLLTHMAYDFTGARSSGPYATLDLECAIIVANV